MKNLLLSLTVLFASQSFADMNFKRTLSSDSVQAILWTALHDYRLADLNSKFPTAHVKLSEVGSGLVIKEEKTSLTCSSGSEGMLAAESYACILKGDISEWTSSSDSVQAVIYETLSDLRTNGGVYAKYVEPAIHGGALKISDENVQIVCESRSLGLAAVQSYRCTIEKF